MAILKVLFLAGLTIFSFINVLNIVTGFQHNGRSCVIHDNQTSTETSSLEAPANFLIIEGFVGLVSVLLIIIITFSPSAFYNPLDGICIRARADCFRTSIMFLVLGVLSCYSIFMLTPGVIFIDLVINCMDHFIIFSIIYFISFFTFNIGTVMGLFLIMFLVGLCWSHCVKLTEESSIDESDMFSKIFKKEKMDCPFDEEGWLV